MAEVSRAVLKTYFQDGKEPDENKFIDLIDTMGLNDHGPVLKIDGAVGQQREIRYRSGDLPRWLIIVSGGAESGGNVGSDFIIQSRKDDGTYLANPFKIVRASGDIGIGGITPLSKLHISGTQFRWDSTQVAGDPGILFLAPDTNHSEIRAGRVDNYATLKHLLLRGSAVDIQGNSLRTASFQAEGKDTDWYHGTDGLTLSQRILGYASSLIAYHFDGSDYPIGGFSWATYSPFGTQTPVETASLLRIAGNANNLAFYSKGSPSSGGWFLPYFSSPNSGQYVGLRYDDGTDNNYMMVHATIMVDPNGSGFIGIGIGVSRRTGGGAVATTYGTWLPIGSQIPMIRCHQEGTKWSNWSLMPMIYSAPNGTIQRCPKPYYASFTPTRIGWAFSLTTTAWKYAGLDYASLYA